jgi:hypothetical protein
VRPIYLGEGPYWYIAVYLVGHNIAWYDRRKSAYVAVLGWAVPEGTDHLTTRPYETALGEH